MNIRSRKPTKRKNFSFWVTDEDHAKIIKYLDDNKLNFSDLVRELIMTKINQKEL